MSEHIEAIDQEILKTLGFETVEGALRVKGEVVSEDTRSWTQIVNPPGTLRRFYLKVFDYRKSYKKQRYLFRKSHCLREFESLERLRKLNIPCPKPVAVGERRSFFLPKVAFLVTEALDDFVDLESRMKDKALSSEERRQVIECLASQVARMHDASFIDRDLKFRNILVRFDDGRCELAHVDSSQGRIRRGAAFKRGVIHDLGTLLKHAPEFFTEKEMLRFLASYGKNRRLNSTAKRDLANRTVARSEELWLRTQKSGRKRGKT